MGTADGALLLGSPRCAIMTIVGIFLLLLPGLGVLGDAQTCTIEADCVLAACEDSAACVDGVCIGSPMASTAMCRPAYGDCDSAEFCDGANGTCPRDRGWTPDCLWAVDGLPLGNLSQPHQMVLDTTASRGGNIIIGVDSDHNRIARILLAQMISVSSVTHIAGSPTYQSGRDDGPGIDAKFSRPMGIVQVASIGWAVTDWRLHILRLILRSEMNNVSTIGGLAGVRGTVDGVGSSARFSAPAYMAADAQRRTYYIGDDNNNCLRRWNLSVVALEYAAEVQTLAGQCGVPGYADGPATLALFRHAMGVTVASMGTILFATDWGNHKIRKVTDLLSSPIVTTVGNVPNPHGIAVHPLYALDDESNLVYVVSMSGTKIVLYNESSDSTSDVVVNATLLENATNIMLHPDGLLLVTRSTYVDPIVAYCCVEPWRYGTDTPTRPLSKSVPLSQTFTRSPPRTKTKTFTEHTFETYTATVTITPTEDERRSATASQWPPDPSLLTATATQIPLPSVPSITPTVPVELAEVSATLTIELQQESTTEGPTSTTDEPTTTTVEPTTTTVEPTTTTVEPTTTTVEPTTTTEEPMNATEDSSTDDPVNTTVPQNATNATEPMPEETTTTTTTVPTSVNTSAAPSIVPAPVVTATTATAGAVAALSVASSGSGASADMQALIVLGTMQCSDESLRELMASSDRLLVPFRIGSGPLSGVLGIVVCAATVVMLHASALRIALPAEMSVEQRCAVIRFPSLSITIVTLLFQGCAFECLRVMIVADGGDSSWGARLLCSMVLLTVLLLPAMMSWRIAFAHKARYVRHKLRCRVTPRGLRTLFPFGFWVRSTETCAFGSALQPLAGSQFAAVFMLPYVSGVALALVANLPIPCEAQAVIMTAVFAVIAVGIVVVRPYRQPISTGVKALSSALMACLCAMKFSPFIREAAPAIALAVTAASIVGTGSGIACALWERKWVKAELAQLDDDDERAGAHSLLVQRMNPLLQDDGSSP